jgi:hypothetical protein
MEGVASNRFFEARFATSFFIIMKFYPNIRKEVAGGHEYLHNHEVYDKYLAYDGRRERKLHNRERSGRHEWNLLDLKSGCEGGRSSSPNKSWLT